MRLVFSALLTAGVLYSSTVSAGQLSDVHPLLAKMQDEILEAKAFIADELGQEVESVEVDQKLFGVPVIAIYTSDRVLYYTHDMTKLFFGDVYQVKDDYANLTDIALGKKRVVKASELMVKAISFTVSNAKKDVYVFTDVDCGYCVELHENKEAYLNAGINLHYLPFPLDDEGTLSFAKNKQVWCEGNKHEAFELAVSNKLPIKPDCDVDFNKMIITAANIGVSATPTLLTKEGVLYEGLYSPEELVELLSDSH
jgi:thiol:disulfide interchange protein DsbC